MESPEPKASWLSLFTYHWLQPLLKQGFNRPPLTQEDLYQLAPNEQAANIVRKFEDAWQKELAKHSDRPKIMRAMHHAFGREFYTSALYRFIGDQAMVWSPLLLQIILQYIRQYSSVTGGATNKQTTSYPYWSGYVMVVGLFLLQIVQALFTNRSYALSMRTGYYLRSAIITVIFQKSMRLSALSRQRFTAGKIMNIISTDTNRLDLVFMIIHFLWSAPLQMLTAFGMLWWYLGPSCLVGLAVIVLSLPLQLWVIKGMGTKRNQASRVADQRIKIIQEVLQGIKVAKLYAWEESFSKIISDIRDKELNSVGWILMSHAIIASVMQTVPIIACIATFIVYAATNNQFDSDFAYFALALFYVLRIPLIIYPSTISRTIDSIVAFKRVQELLIAPELDGKALEIADSTSEYALKLVNASFVWEGIDTNDADKHMQNESDEKSKVFIGLHSLDLAIKRGELVAVVGQVGGGKSSLIHAMIGEMKRTEGVVEINGSLAFCAQNAWIQNITVRDNIIFGNDFDEQKYAKVIRDCALERDLEILPAGDQTEIGEKGVNLSGGQKQRINMARAVYNSSDIILMDDPLSAVDAHVCTHIFEECIRKAMDGKTRILVTHRLNLLPQTDYVVVMDNGKIVEQGTYEDLVKKSSVLKKMLSNAELDPETIATTNTTMENPQPNAANLKTESFSIVEEKPQDKKESKIIAVEEKGMGVVGWDVYFEYAKLFGGGWVVVSIVLFTFLAQGSRIMTDLWLNIWVLEQFGDFGYYEYESVYAGLGAIQVLLMIIVAVIFSVCSVRACRKIHQTALEKVLTCPMSWFDSQPLGRLINRFSRDIDTIDSLLPETFRVFSFTMSMTISILIMICVALPLFIAPLVPVLIIYWYVQHYYRRSSIELKRLDNTTRSPLFAQISETFAGSGQSTIRAYKAQKRFIDKNLQLLDQNNRSYYLTIMAQRWLSFRLEILASVLIFFAAILGIIGKDSLDPGLVGLAITYSLQVTFVFYWAIRQSTEMEMYLNSLERLMNYAYELENENDPAPTEKAEIESKDSVVLRSVRVVPEKSWPQTGAVEFDEVFLRYREDLPDVLEGISFSVKDREKVGIVGRTGAGKSSLIYALFLLTKLKSGKIKIDGLDISQIPLNILRTRIAIIPQDPVIFSGTLRDNLDPLKLYADEQIWEAIKHCGIYDAIDKTQGLMMPVSEGGENWSTGQRQLICLARALLKRSRILILDEATASVDMATDALIQKTLREYFADSTIITIAHRLNTVMDYDKIVVLDFGKVKEIGSPKELMVRKGIFFSMVTSENGPELKPSGL